MASLTSTKRVLRKQVAAALSVLSPPTIKTQSAAVLSHLETIPAYTSSRCATVYLPMDGGGEVDTWPILADLLMRGVKVGVPRVVGPRSADMRMLRVESLESAKAFPRTKWGIPEPDEALASSMEDMTIDGEFDLLLVPGMAFDARCNRLGHGKGYYDSFIAQVRARREAGLTVIGLGLEPQLVETVPVGDYDQRLDLVVHPAGRLAYASAADQQAGAAYQSAARDGEGESPSKCSRTDDSSANFDASAEPPALAERIEERVELAEGRHKYVCLRVSRGGESFLVVRSGRGDYHANVAEPAIDLWEAKGYRAQPLGGGRIVVDTARRTVHVYGYSVGLGGEEGGPPGHGMSDHSDVAALIEKVRPDYTTTFSAEGY